MHYGLSATGACLPVNEVHIMFPSPRRRVRLSASILSWIAAGYAAVGCAAGDTSDRARSGAGAAGSLSLKPGATGNSFTNPSLAAMPVSPASNSGKACASAVVRTTKTMPSIVFVIDGSGSMCAPFGSGTRWQALRSALLDPNKGLVYRLQNSVRFGATLYDGTIDSMLALGGIESFVQNPPCALLAGALGGKDVGMCPLLVEAMPPALNNAQAIDMVYPQVELGGSTPTDKALDHVMNALIATRRQQGPDDQAQSPVYVILATDGAPNDICVNGTGGDGSVQRQGVIAAVDRGATAGITTWVISLADGDAALQTHLDEVAKHGDPKNAAARTFVPTSPDELIMTLAQLLGGAVGCHVELQGTVTAGQECSGTVEQDGMALPCCEQAAAGSLQCAGAPTSAPDGWRLSDPHSIELLGGACAKFLLSSDAVLDARFPCAVFRPD
jgi:Mg-chelatase subunit ChlD